MHWFTSIPKPYFLLEFSYYVIQFLTPGQRPNCALESQILLQKFLYKRLFLLKGNRARFEIFCYKKLRLSYKKSLKLEKASKSKCFSHFSRRVCLAASLFCGEFVLRRVCSAASLFCGEFSAASLFAASFPRRVVLLRHCCDVSKLCCPGVKSWRWAPPLAHACDREKSEGLIF